MTQTSYGGVNVGFRVGILPCSDAVFCLKYTHDHAHQSHPKESGHIHVHTLSDEFLEELRQAVALIRHGRKLEAEIKIQDALVVEIYDDAEMREFVFSNYSDVHEILETGEDAIYVVRDIKGRLEILCGRE